MSDREDIISGQFKFKDIVGRARLVEFAKTLKENPHYLFIAVRRTSKDQIAILFLYKTNMRHEVSLDTFRDEVVPKLKKEFSDNFCGWDLAGTTYLLKQEVIEDSFE